MLAHPIKTNSLKLRAADIAYNAIESMIITLQLKPGMPIVESDLIELTGLGRTPLREALMRMSSNGLIFQLPRRGLIISDIEPGEHFQAVHRLAFELLGSLNLVGEVANQHVFALRPKRDQATASCSPLTTRRTAG